MVWSQKVLQEDSSELAEAETLSFSTFSSR
jgi:hypothetical protein